MKDARMLLIQNRFNTIRRMVSGCRMLVNLKADGLMGDFENDY